MMEANELTEKVINGLRCHAEDGKCARCPYNKITDDVLYDCSEDLVQDAFKVIMYWKHKAEYNNDPRWPKTSPSSVQTSIVKINSRDRRDAAKYANALKDMADAGNMASKALCEVTDAISNLKEVLKEVLNDA